MESKQNFRPVIQSKISTQRLSLGKLTVYDHEFILTLVNTQPWHKFIGDRNIHTIEDAIAYINKINATPDYTYWVVRLKDTNAAMGIITFLKRIYLPYFDIGFAFLPEYFGKGYAYEAASEVLANVKELPDYSIVLAATVADNVNSIRLLRKLGFSFKNEMENEGNRFHVYSSEVRNNTQDQTNSLPANISQNIGVIELRNYVLKPGMRDSFINYFENNFIHSQNETGASILGTYGIKGAINNFFWIRGFSNLTARKEFLPAFYFGPFWEAHRENANAMLANNDNVHLLKPLELHKDVLSTGTIDSAELKKNKGIAIIEFYIANTKLDKLVELFSKEYLKIIKKAGIREYSVWVSELEENSFPPLPVFQDKNLLVTIAFYKDEADYLEKQKDVQAGISNELSCMMTEIITTKNTLIAYPVSG